MSFWDFLTLILVGGVVLACVLSFVGFAWTEYREISLAQSGPLTVRQFAREIGTDSDFVMRAVTNGMPCFRVDGLDHIDGDTDPSLIRIDRSDAMSWLRKRGADMQRRREAS